MKTSMSEARSYNGHHIRCSCGNCCTLSAILHAWAQEAPKKLAAWMIEHSFSTGHGDTLEDLLKELSWQVAELRAALEQRTGEPPR